MPNFLSKLLVVFLGLSIIGCKRVTIENGRVPHEHVAKAQEYVGEYVGKFNGKSGKLILSVDNSDYVKLSFVDGHNNDLIGAECESKIGDLWYLYFQGTTQNPELTQATFHFDVNKCRDRVLGISLEVYFNAENSSKSVALSIIESQKQHTICTGPYPNNCHDEFETKFLRGQFTKISN